MTSKAATYNAEEFKTPTGTPVRQREVVNEKEILGSSMEENKSERSSSIEEDSGADSPKEKENVTPDSDQGGSSSHGGSSSLAAHSTAAEEVDNELAVDVPDIIRKSDSEDEEVEPAFLVEHAPEEQEEAVEESIIFPPEPAAISPPPSPEPAAAEVQECALVLSGDEEDEDGFVLINDNYCLGDSHSDAPLSESYDIVGDNSKTKHQ